MSNQSQRRSKRIRNLITTCALTAIVLSVSTFAWFIGMKTVNISSFDVEIASTDSLMLSLDGHTWSSTINISPDTYKPELYTENTNNWAGRGLIPMSSVGDMDNEVSRMMLFEKASLTPTAGGYRIMASRVNNYDDNPEQDGYVVFDLFIHNYSGNQYLTNLEEKDEEAIFLTNDSEVTVSTNGGVGGTGIENSVRVAFAQIGRVNGKSLDEGVIRNISCTTDTNVVGICRTAQIWEPNDTDHVANAISYYDTSCRSRTGADVTKSASYSDSSSSCKGLTNGLAYPTYAIRRDVSSGDNVDVYDGFAYNGYTAVIPEGETAPIQSYPYFTDTMKLKTGTSRPQFMTLEPNSITKVRVYIYIEGQDVDNYDFASIGKEISVKFGFTKERYTEDDIGYEENEGPDLNQGEGPNADDKTPPVITLTGDSQITLPFGTAYDEQGATVIDNTDTTLTPDDIDITGKVNASVPGTYRILYKVTDAAGNTGTKTRIVVVEPQA